MAHTARRPAGERVIYIARPPLTTSPGTS